MREGVDRAKLIKRMTELMRSGAVMLDQSCPLCNSPLFRLKDGSLVCPIHGEVKVVRDEREAIEVTTNAVLDLVEKIASNKLLNLINEVSKDSVSSDVLNLVSQYLDIIEKVRRIKSIKRGDERSKQ